MTSNHIFSQIPFHLPKFKIHSMGLFKQVLWSFILATAPLILFSQTTLLKGQLVDGQTSNPLADVQVVLDGTRLGTTTLNDGSFSLKVPFGENQLLLFTLDNYDNLNLPFSATSDRLDLGKIQMQKLDGIQDLASEDIIPTISLADADIENADLAVQNISGLLTATRDIFVATAAFTFGPRRFRIRGLNSENTTVLLNGAPMNDLESGRPYFGSWGGLNDVIRNFSGVTVGIAPSDYTLGGVGGASIIDARASQQRVQTRFSYARSNRSYNNRLMFTHSTGMLKGGWSFAISGSARWAEEGYVEGTSFEAYSYFFGAEKKINDKHSLAFTALGTPSRRGRSIAATDELYSLAGSNFYNPWWGYQNGKKRNARVSEFHQPIGVITHDWQANKKLSILTAVSYQSGRAGSTALDWFDAQNPYPDYYRNSIAYWNYRTEQSADQSVLEQFEQLYSQNPDARQIDWADMYESNRQFYDVIENADGIDGHTVSGFRAAYLLEDRRYDSDKLNFNTILQAEVSNQVDIRGGFTWQSFHGHNFKKIVDLLGADFHVNVDQFASRDSLQNNDFIQNDLNNPNQVVKEGDIFGYDYNTDIRQAKAWIAADISSSTLDAFLGLEFSNTQFWRTGNYRNGRFPDDSFGESEKQKFNNAGVKAGLTYKVDGRNYFFLNANLLNRAPFFRNAYVSPRTRDQVVPNLSDEQIFGLEGGYFLRSPYARARISGYFNSFQNQFYNRSLLVEFTDVITNTIVNPDGGSSETVSATSTRGFGNYIMTDINTRHMGLELAGEIQVSASLKINAVVALGDYIYANNPTAFIALDNQPNELKDIRRVYLKGFKIAGTPQKAGTIGLNYNSAKYWFANINFNYVDGVYIEPFPDFRTMEAVSITNDPTYQQQTVEPGSPLWKEIIDQEQGDGAFSIDLFGGKSWKFNDTFVYLTVGISNLLDDKDFITGGFEQFDLMGQRLSEKRPDLRPARYFYGFGRNYFAQVAVRF